MKGVVLYFLIIFFTIMNCCNAQKQPKNNQIDKDFFIPIEKSNLYTRIIGNTKKPVIIALHGGPGAFSVDHEFYRNVFEKDYLVVYFDQRGSGKSDECKDKSMLTTDQFVKDLDIVVDYIKDIYPEKKINFIGTSWGGTYGLLYMLKHQEKINSFICSSGFANSPQRNIALVAHERQLATELLQTTKDSTKKKKYEEILTKLDEIEKNKFKNFFNDMNIIRFEYPKDLGFDVYWAKPELKEKVGELLKDSSFYARAKYTPKLLEKAMAKFDYINEVFINTESYNNLNILNEIAVIKKPVLVIQGEYDYAIGVEQGKMIYDALKNIPKNDKELIYVPDASHNIPIEEPEIYFNALKTFIDKHN